MLAYRMSQAGAKASLQEIDPPRPDQSEVLVRIRACGLNFADLLMQKGTYQDTPEPPFTLGMEVAGEVVETGPNVTGWQPGDRVMVYARQGGLAALGSFPADRLIRLPDGMSFEQAAAFQIGYGTAHIALGHRARLQPGETLLVTGAGGGTGRTAVEIGARMGARVIAAARGADKLEIARAAGATDCIDTGTEDLRTRLLELGRIDVAYDTVGGDLFKAAFRAMKPEGRLLPVGFAGGDVPQIPANHLLVKNLTVIGFYIGGYLNFRSDVVQDSFATLLGWFNDGLLHPHVGQVLPLEQVSAGMELLRSRQAVGKVVITP